MMNSKWIAAVIALLVCAFVGSAVATAQPDNVTMTATINGQDVGAASGGNPVRLHPGESVTIAIELTNHGTEAVDVRRVELAGRVVGLTFFSYATSAQFTVRPGAKDTLRYQLDLTGLEGQATGLIGGALTVIDSKGKPIASIPTVTDVRGSLVSVYGLFGIALAVLTALALLDAALAVAKHRLSQNRAKRGVRLLAPGIGIGLVIAFSASVVRLWVPSTGLWLVVAGLTAAVFFALGYFSPTPHDEDDEDDDEDEFDDDEDDRVLLEADTEQVSSADADTQRAAAADEFDQ
jgi:hypothetical protein